MASSHPRDDGVADESPEKECPEAAIERPVHERDRAADQCNRHAPAQVDADRQTAKNRKDFRDENQIAVIVQTGSWPCISQHNDGEKAKHLI